MIFKIVSKINLALVDVWNKIPWMNDLHVCSFLIHASKHLSVNSHSNLDFLFTNLFLDSYQNCWKMMFVFFSLIYFFRMRKNLILKEKIQCSLNLKSLKRSLKQSQVSNLLLVCSLKIFECMHLSWIKSICQVFKKVNQWPVSWSNRQNQ